MRLSKYQTEEFMHEKAKEIAENTDSGEFVEDGAGDWEYDRTEDKDGNVLD